MQVIMKIGTLIVLEVLTSIIAVNETITLTSWITCPNSCNNTDSTKFKMQLFKNTNGESSVQVLEIDGNVNFTGMNIKWNDTERKRNGEPDLRFFICFNGKDITNWLLINRSIHKSICENFTLHNDKRNEVISDRLAKSGYWSSWTDNFTAFNKRDILCTENQCREGASCNCIYVANSEIKKEVSNLEKSTEGVENDRTDSSTSYLNYQTGNGTFSSSSDSKTSNHEQSISPRTENGIYIQTRRSAQMWTWLMLIGSVIIFVIILSFGLFKIKGRRPKTRNATAVNNSFRSEAYYTNNVVSDTQQFSNQQLEYFDFASSENAYDVAYQWNERSRCKSNLFDHVDMNVRHSRVGLGQNVKLSNIDDAAVDSKQYSNQQLEYCDAEFSENEYDVAYHWKERNEGKSNLYDHMDMLCYSRVGLSHNTKSANKDDAAVNTKFLDQQSEYFDFSSPGNEYDVAYHWNERRKDESNLYNHVDMNMRCSRVGFSRSRQHSKTDSDLC